MSRNLSFFFVFLSHTFGAYVQKNLSHLDYVQYKKNDVKYAISVDKFPDWIFEFCTRLTNDLTKAKIAVGPQFFFHSLEE